MFRNIQNIDDPEVKKLRKQGGLWLKSLREESNLTQREFAELVGAEYYTFISQIENGRGRVPPDKYRLWAKHLNITPKEFVKGIMRYYDPLTYDILFSDEDATATVETKH
jgi:transcriptional regulator with XRE-family HTH domain